MGYPLFLDFFFFSCILEYRTEFIILTPKFMPHSHHWFRENLSFVYISFQYFLLSFYNIYPSFFLHSKTVQSFSCVQLFATPWTAAHQASLSITNSQSLLKLMSIELVMPSNHLILCHPLLLLPSILLRIRGFSKESVLHIRWPMYWSFSFSISPSNKY